MVKIVDTSLLVTSSSHVLGYMKCIIICKYVTYGPSVYVPSPPTPRVTEATPESWRLASAFYEYDPEEHEVEQQLGFLDPSNPPVQGCNLK